MTRLWCDGPTLLRAVASAVANLERHVAEVDALNVFPVPDGDTGSNMLATMRAALGEAERLAETERDLETVAQALSRGALAGARGSSGVILSQIIRGMTHGAGGRRRASGADLAEGLRRGSEIAYEAVLTPVEGTILTVIRDAAEAAEAAAGQGRHVERVLAVAIEEAARSVARTPLLLPLLQEAGVVDSGGQGLYRLLQGTFLLDGAAIASEARARSTGLPGVATDAPAHPDAPEHPLIEQYGYETTYLLTAAEGGLDVASLRHELESLGDSVVVAGDSFAARVHVHGQRPDLAIALGLRAGRISDVSISDLDAQTREHGASAVARTVAIVAVADSDGQAAVLSSVGVAGIIRPAKGARPSAGEIAQAVLTTGATDVIILPNDADTLLAAQQAASLSPRVDVSVVPTRNVAEGVVAALAFDPATATPRNVERMGQEASALRSFSVARAVRDAVLDGQPVRHGQFVAFDAGTRLIACDDDPVSTSLRALSQLEGEGFELVSLYHGDHDGGPEAQELADRIVGTWPGVDVEVVRGGHARVVLLVAVE